MLSSPLQCTLLSCAHNRSSPSLPAGHQSCSWPYPLARGSSGAGPSQRTTSPSQVRLMMGRGMVRGLSKQTSTSLSQWTAARPQRRSRRTSFEWPPRCGACMRWPPAMPGPSRTTRRMARTQERPTPHLPALPLPPLPLLPALKAGHFGCMRLLPRDMPTAGAPGPPPPPLPHSAWCGCAGTTGRRGCTPRRSRGALTSSSPVRWMMGRGDVQPLTDVVLAGDDPATVPVEADPAAAIAEARAAHMARFATRGEPAPPGVTPGHFAPGHGLDGGPS